jgi:DNA-binding XRE family transcriptional regulator
MQGDPFSPHPLPTYPGSEIEGALNQPFDRGCHDVARYVGKRSSHSGEFGDQRSFLPIPKESDVANCAIHKMNPEHLGYRIHSIFRDLSPVRGITISFPVKLGRRISDLRGKRGLSQTQLADMAGIGRAHLSQIENGAAAARITTLYAIAQTLEIKLEELFKGF